jgi:hypothetical protein
MSEWVSYLCKAAGRGRRVQLIHQMSIPGSLDEESGRTAVAAREIHGGV